MLKIYQPLGFLLAFSVWSIQIIAQPVTLQDTILRIDSLFTSWNTSTPGGSLTIARGGQIIYSKAFGMADLEHHLANTTETIFEAGSVSKQFTAAAILLLVKDGKLSLQDDVRQYVPEIPDFGYKITLWHLMTHTSGLRDWGSVAGISGWARGKRVHTHAHVLEILSRQKGLNFPPGDQYSYCNSGYNLLAIIVDRVSGMSFSAFCKQRIFDPTGMKHTQWRTDYRTVVPNRSIAYNQENGVYLQNMPFEMVHGQGGLLTTTEDLIAWNQHYKHSQIFGNAFLEMELTRAKLNNNVLTNYAAGLSIGLYNGSKEISHSGATAGYRAWLAYYPEVDLSIALLSNAANANPVSTGMKVVSIFLGPQRVLKPVLSEMVPDAKSLNGKAGLYKSLRSDAMVQLEVRNGKLYFRNSEEALPATAANTFYRNDDRLEFDKDKLVWHSSNGDTMTYVKQKPFLTDFKDFVAYVGTYQSSEAEALFTIEQKNEQLQVFIKPDIRYSLTPLYEDTFQSEVGELFYFQRDKLRKVNGFKFSTDRASGIIFSRTNISK